jgi:NDP-sugar pyrophosphorylase family protein
MKKPLTVVALFGGTASRFWPLSTNKALFPFMGNPLIDYSVNKILPKDTKKLVIVANNDNINVFKKMNFSVPTSIVLQKQAKGMADAILSAEKEIVGSQIIILIGDHLVNKDLLDQILKEANDSKAFGILPGVKVHKNVPYGYLIFDHERIIGIKEKPLPGTEPSDYIYITGNYFENADILVNELKQTTSDKDDVYEKALTKLMDKYIFKIYKYQGISSALKHPWDVLSINHNILCNYLQNHQGENCQIKSNVI